MSHIMAQKYILTGAPGSGKTSLILALEQRGEYVLREAAEDYIRYCQAHGQKEPWKENDFQDKILELQLLREARLPLTGRVFLDRGIPDGMAYAQQTTEIYKRILAEAKKVCYSKIFFIDVMDIRETTTVRRENTAEALSLALRLKEAYISLGYTPVCIPPGTLEERVGLILEVCNKP